MSEVYTCEDGNMYKHAKIFILSELKSVCWTLKDIYCEYLNNYAYMIM